MNKSLNCVTVHCQLDPGSTKRDYLPKLRNNSYRAGRSDGTINELLNFDTTAQTVRWRVAGKFQGNPAYASGVLYAINASPLRLEAHAETDGSLLWSWAPQLNTEIRFIGDVLVTNNLVFVSTNVATYAISQNTHQIVWSMPAPGWLALSASGVLFIVLAKDGHSITSGQILAINVKN